MLIAQELRKSNIIEYIIYLFQIEDLVRLFNADIEKIKEQHIKHFNLKGKQYEDCVHWYNTICTMMKEENILQQGHLQFLHLKINELYEFHLQLYKSNEEDAYRNFYDQASPHLKEFINTSKLCFKNELEAAVTAMYFILLLRLKKASISKETEQSIDIIGRWLSILAQKYKEFEEGIKEFF